MKEQMFKEAVLRGIDRTTRDFNQPFELPRVMDNVSLPDGRPSRRRGYAAIQDPVITQALCKATPITHSKKLQETDHAKGVVAVTPLSYGLIKWHQDYRLNRGESKTIEFSLRLGNLKELTESDFQRLANYPGQWTNYLLRRGVYLLDQTVLSNNHKFNTGYIEPAGVVPGTQYDLSGFLAPDQFDVFPLTALSIAINATGFLVRCHFVDVAIGPNEGTYYPMDMVIPWVDPYFEGQMLHFAMVWDHDLGDAPGTFNFYINGVLVETYELPRSFGVDWKFAGEQDYINGLTPVDYAYSGEQRDIVILNECTVRGSYSSTCKIRGDMHGHQTFFHPGSNLPSIQQSVPWASSPPQGTAMWDLRIWSEARDAADIAILHQSRITAPDDYPTLVGNWYLNDGGPVCVNHVTGLTQRFCTVHHGYPGYVNEGTFIGDQGLKLGEGQHLIASFPKGSRDNGSGLAAQLDNIFDDTVSAVPSLKHREQHSFTVQIQIKIGEHGQVELNKTSTAPANMRDLALVEVRQAMNTGCIPEYDSLMDGTAETGVSARNFIGHATDPVPGPNINQHLRAFDQTLWSIEGTQLKEYSGTGAATNEANRRRIPVARGVLTPTNHVAFELFKSQIGGAQPKYCRLRSTLPISANSTWTITFVQRANYTYDAVTHLMDSNGWVMEIWLQEIPASGPLPAIVLYSHTFSSASNITTGALAHEQEYDITVGASYVNDGWDHSINMPFPQGVVPTNRTSFVKGGGAQRDNHGPWPVQQRFMSPYQDQPGNFMLGMFRMWSKALTQQQILAVQNSIIDKKDRNSDLLINLELTEKTGTEIPNKSSYPDSFKMGYKGWGMPQSYRNFIYITITNNAYLKKELFEGTWAYEDCLGYMPITKYTETPGSYTSINGLAPFRASSGLQFGTLVVYDDAPAFDRNNVGGVFTPLFATNHGLMSELVPGLSWRGTVIGDRTILTSQNSLPKVFDGKSLHTAGFKRWNGGTPVAYPTAAVPGGLTAGWYGVVLVYWSEKFGIYHVSPVATCELSSSNAIGLYMVPQHPDTRVTLIEVYRTLPQATESLAKAAPLFKTRMGGGNSLTVGVGGGNVFCEALTIAEADSELASFVLDRDVTEMPMCAYSASLNDQLYLTGDVLNPDVVYFCDPGNPERIDALFNSIKLPEGSGDLPTGIISAFEAILVFKPNAIWRIDNIGGNRHQLTKLASIGAISSRSIQVINNPDTGRTSVFFWSKFGPYILDYGNLNYVGYPIERNGLENESTPPEYSWLDPQSVVVGHDPLTREIICFYTPRYNNGSSIVNLPNSGEAMVYNYRTNSWYRYTGVSCKNSISLVFGDFTSTKLATNPDFASFEYKLIFGHTNGTLYYWGESTVDGAPLGKTFSNPYLGSMATLDTFSSISGLFTGIEDLTGCWVTVVDNTTKRWYTAPVISFTRGSISTVTLDPSWRQYYGFTLTIGSKYSLYFCQQHWLIEFAWNNFGIPFFDKKLVEFVTWHDGLMQYKIGYGYNNISPDSTWIPMKDADSKRHRVQINKASETFKLQFSSLDSSASLEAVSFLVAPTKGATLEQ